MTSDDAMTSHPDPFPQDWTVDDRSDDPARDLADEILGHLHRHPDAATTYRAIQYLRSDLQLAAATTLKRLELDLGGVGPAADAVGISRQAVTELYTKTGTPGPRTDRDRDQRPAHRYGALLATCQRAAAISDASSRRRGTQAMLVWDKLARHAEQATTTWTTLRRMVLGSWLHGIDTPDAHAVRDRIAELEPAADELGVRHLNMSEQADVMIGYHRERKQLTTP